MLISQVFERTAQDDLYIHSHNRMHEVVALVICGVAVIVPIVLIFMSMAGSFSLGEMHPLHVLMLGILMLLIPALIVLMLVYTGVRETLWLSRLNSEGQRITRNMFGRRKRVQATFSIKSPKHLELRRHPDAKPRDTQLWLVMRDGTEQRLTTNCVPVVPGSERTQRWLRELADYLQVAVPSDVVEAVANRAATVMPVPPPVKGKKAVKGGKRRKGEAPELSAELTGKIGVPARVVLTLVGAFMVVLELTRVINLVPAFFTGRLSVSGNRGRPTTYFLMDQP